ncbi:hypothetical protein WH47_10378 [Habropoda laboriosa]|uniref:Luc7-like protein 3 n=1 Tax=Habropoda laboriosa TaxID=597456 RepID=A0A0L7R9R5_9HYME|nr:hypothetical protein WH47_10378 [Habropoda laboriosa]
MARYSSESDSDHNSRYRRKRNRRSRSSSSDSSESSPHRRRSSKHSKTKRRHRSHSRSRGRDRDRSQKSYKSSRNSSSKGRERHRYRSRSRSLDHSKRKVRSTSREKSGSRSNDFPIEPRFKEGVLEEINSEGFTPKQFSSSSTKEKKFKNIVIDISADTIQVPTVAEVPCGSESIFHSSIMIDQEARFDKWVKKLYTLRQKAIADLIHSNIT